MNMRIVMRPICWVLGHRRGKFVKEGLSGGHIGGMCKFFRCPRCAGNETRYKVRPK